MTACQIALDFAESERSAFAKNAAAGRNPYEKQPGFARRVLRAKKAYEAYGRDYNEKAHTRLHSREIDNCFEMCDGRAVVWALMAEAIGGNADLAEGIKRTGAAVWPHWLRVYQGEPS